MALAVGQVARLAGVSVRTLHHYDRIGLLRPAERTRAGYRGYTETDLQRLEQVLFYRELGFSLDRIAAVLADPAADRMTHLRRQRELLSRRIDRLRAMLAAIDTAMEAYTMDIPLSAAERLELFGGFDPERYEQEVRDRWGGSDAYEQSRRRMSAMTKDDWARFADEGGRLTRELARAFTAGEPATGPAAMDLAERHRQHITTWCYDCTYDIHRGLGEMYVADPRFTATFDTVTPGLAAYVRDAIHANAARAGA